MSRKPREQQQNTAKQSKRWSKEKGSLEKLGLLGHRRWWSSYVLHARNEGRYTSRKVIWKYEQKAKETNTKYKNIQQNKLKEEIKKIWQLGKRYKKIKNRPNWAPEQVLHTRNEGILYTGNLKKVLAYQQQAKKTTKFTTKCSKK